MADASAYACFDGSALDPYRCESLDDCAAGQLCVDSFCVSRTSDGSGASDSGGGNGTDAGLSGTDSGGGGGTDAGICETCPFGTPTVVDELSDAIASDDDPTLTADLLEIFF